MPRKPVQPKPVPSPSPRPFGKKPRPQGPTPLRQPGRATKPAYGRSGPEKLVDEVGKALRRMPSDLAKGGEMVRGAFETLKDRARRIRKGTK